MPSPLSELLDHPAARPIVWISTIILLVITAYSITNFIKGGPQYINDLGSDIKIHAQAGHKLGVLLHGQKVAIILAPEQSDNPIATASYQIQSAFVQGLKEAGITDIKELFLPPMPTLAPGNRDETNVWFSSNDLIQFRKQAQDCQVLILPMGLPAFVTYTHLAKLPTQEPRLVVMGGSDNDHDAIKSAMHRGSLLAAMIPNADKTSYTVLTKETIDQ